MDDRQLRMLLENIKAGNIAVEEAVERLRKLPFEDLGFAKVDHHRALRNGFPEVIFCKHKTVEQVTQIFARLAEEETNILATRANTAMYESVRSVCPEATYHPLARTITLERRPLPLAQGTILVISAGTADLPVAEEAVVTARMMGNKVETLYDVGVAGIHRLLANTDKLARASVIIVAAGMDGALPSVVAGLVRCPVIALPTSIGYGASLGGIAALLTMLNSCAMGVGVVNIDNGFGAGCLASKINHLNEVKA